MDWELELTFATRTVIAALLGAMIGFERQHHGRDAGIRTYAAVALGSCLFAIISSRIEFGDPSRIASNIVTGVGFLGAGVIIRSNRGRTVGLTTAATLWASAAVGTGIGFGFYLNSVVVAFLVLLILYAQVLPGWTDWRRNGDDDSAE